MRSTEYVSFLAAQQGGGNGSMFFMIILMFIIMYFLLIRPQKLRQRELQQRIDKIKTGDKILTAAGIHGMVANVKESTIILKVADNVKIEFEKASIAKIFPREDESQQTNGGGASS